MSNEYMVVMVNGDFGFRRVVERRINLVLNRPPEFKKQPELFEGETLAITWPPDGIYRIVKLYS